MWRLLIFLFLTISTVSWAAPSHGHDDFFKTTSKSGASICFDMSASYSVSNFDSMNNGENGENANSQDADVGCHDDCHACQCFAALISTSLPLVVFGFSQNQNFAVADCYKYTFLTSPFLPPRV